MRKRKTRQVRIGDVKVGGGAPVSIQSMTKTDTKDVPKTVKEIKKLEAVGCQIVRVAVKDEKSARCIGNIKKGIKIPLVADIHFNYKLGLIALENGADAVRLNPGNIKKSGLIKNVLSAARERRKPIRIGVNSGSLRTPEMMVSAVCDYLKIFEREGFHDIIVSLKSSDVSDTVEANRQIRDSCDYPLHLGVTAAGLPREGIIKSAIGIGSLLLDGIGDTIRVSLTGDSAEEVAAAKIILQSLGLRQFQPNVVSCPTCGRCQANLIKIVKDLDSRLSTIHYPLSGNRSTTIAIMGCEVNGPGEAKSADIGIAAGKKSGVLFKKGKIIKKIRETDFVKELIQGIERDVSIIRHRRKRPFSNNQS